MVQSAAYNSSSFDTFGSRDGPRRFATLASGIMCSSRAGVKTLVSRLPGKIGTCLNESVNRTPMKNNRLLSQKARYRAADFNAGQS